MDTTFTCNCGTSSVFHFKLPQREIDATPILVRKHPRSCCVNVRPTLDSVRQKTSCISGKSSKFGPNASGVLFSYQNGGRKICCLVTNGWGSIWDDILQSSKCRQAQSSLTSKPTLTTHLLRDTFARKASPWPVSAASSGGLSCRLSQTRRYPRRPSH